MCKRKFLEDASHKDLQLARCPFIDNTMFDCGPTPAHGAVQHALPREMPAVPESNLDEGEGEGYVGDQGSSQQGTIGEGISPRTDISPRTEDSVSADEKASGAVTPVMTFERGPPPSPSATWRSPAGCLAADMSAEDDGSLSPLMSRRRQFCRKRSLSWGNVRSMIQSPVKEMPASPELCGVQAILPRKSGLRVQVRPLTVVATCKMQAPILLHARTPFFYKCAGADEGSVPLLPLSADMSVFRV